MATHAKLKKREQEPIKLGFENNRLHMQVFVEFWKGFMSTAFSMVTAVAIYYADFGAVERP